MIARLVKKMGGNICSNCRVKQWKLEETCSFCGALFSNYEEFLLENWNTLNEDKIKNDYN